MCKIFKFQTVKCFKKIASLQAVYSSSYPRLVTVDFFKCT